MWNGPSVFEYENTNLTRLAKPHWPTGSNDYCRPTDRREESYETRLFFLNTNLPNLTNDHWEETPPVFEISRMTAEQRILSLIDIR